MELRPSGNAMAGWFEWLNQLPFVPVAVGVGVLYGGYFLPSLAALICMGAFPNEQWAATFAAVTVFVTSGLHFGLTGLGYVAVPDYVVYPVAPEWAFLVADVVQAGALVATIASFAIDSSARGGLVAASIVTMCAQILCFYKTYVLVTDVQAGRRDKTGRKMERVVGRR